MLKKFKDFILNEDGEGGGVANATLGNTGGMGNIISPTVSAIPGDVAGSKPGSGDIAAHAVKPAYKYISRKNKKKITKESVNIENDEKPIKITKDTKFKKGDIILNGKFNQFKFEVQEDLGDKVRVINLGLKYKKEPYNLNKTQLSGMKLDIK